MAQLAAGETGAAHLFAPRDAVRLRYAEGGGFGLGGTGSTSTDPHYPDPGIYFDYSLGSAPLGEVVLEVLDHTGTLLRRFSSEAIGEKDQLPAQSSMRKISLERIGTPKLEKTAGHHRFRWNFALPGPWDINSDRSGRNGPWVLPGAYQVRLTVGGWSATQRFRVLRDPRGLADGVTQLDLSQQLGLALAARDLVSETRLLAKRLADRRKESDTPALKALAAKLNAEPTRYPTPRLVEQTAFLYNMTVQADQRMGKDVVDRLAELRVLIANAQEEFAAATR